MIECLKEGCEEQPTRRSQGDNPDIPHPFSNQRDFKRKEGQSKKDGGDQGDQGTRGESPRYMDLIFPKQFKKYNLHLHCLLHGFAHLILQQYRLDRKLFYWKVQDEVCVGEVQ